MEEENSLKIFKDIIIVKGKIASFECHIVCCLFVFIIRTHQHIV